METRSQYELSIIMPCLNEAETVATCIRKAQTFLQKSGIIGEVIIADNGSSDGSPEIAENAGARVVHVETKGYGSAISGGIKAAKSKYIIMGDADDSYDFINLEPFVQKLREGYELVMGNRFKGGIAPKAMPFLHKYLGNPVLTKIGQILFNYPCGDFHCGLRAFTKKAVLEMGLRTTGMEFASEMVVKAALFKMKIAEVPTTLSPDGRSQPSHLRTWRDGWRHLRFLLLYSPKWLFLYPGLILMFIGTSVGLLITHGTVKIYGVSFDLHTLIYSAMAVIIGFQSTMFAVVSKIFVVTQKLLPPSQRLDILYRYLKLEIGLIIGFIFIIFGLGGSIYTIIIWGNSSFGALDPSVTMRIAIPSLTVLTIGVQIILFSFLLSILDLKRK
jgi:glycosyltransferase involved in cell wall biosynthesis